MSTSRGGWLVFWLPLLAAGPVDAACNVSAVAAGGSHSVAIGSDGRVWAWGDNFSFQASDPAATEVPTPVEIPSLAGSIAIAAGESHSLALAPDGSVWAWGSNFYGQLGDGRSGIGADSAAPVQVLGLSGIVAVAAGARFSLALRGDGSVWSWGSDSRGELGDAGANVASPTPVQVAGIGNIVRITAGGYHSLAQDSDGFIWSWGWNAYGQLGNGTYAMAGAPVLVMGLAGSSALAAGYYHSLAVTDDDRVWAWGDNTYDELGTGDFMGSWTLPQPLSSLSGIRSVGAGRTHSSAIGADGRAYTWGRNWMGQLGTGDNVSSRVPVLVPGIASAATGSTFNYQTFVVLDDGTLLGWGLDDFGQLGMGRAGYSSVPRPIVPLAGSLGIGAGNLFGLAIAPDGSAVSWGFGLFGELGDGNFVERNVPAAISGLSGVAALEAGVYHGLARLADGTVRSWGDNTYGQLGDGTFDARTTPVPVVDPASPSGNLENVVSISAAPWYSLAALSDGTVRSWGTSENGALGVIAVNQTAAAVQVEDRGDPTRFLSGVSAVSAGDDFALALKRNGSVFAWGDGAYYQLGNGTRNGAPTAEQVPVLTGIQAITAGGYHGLALDGGGSVWAWGDNTWGQLGDGTTTAAPTPMQIPGLAGVIAIAAGPGSSAAVLADGSAWTWGYSFNGNLGLGTRASSLVPARVIDPSDPSGFLSGVRTIAVGGTTMLALRLDGSTWAWGTDRYGGLVSGGWGQSRTPVATLVPPSAPSACALDLLRNASLASLSFSGHRAILAAGRDPVLDPVRDLRQADIGGLPQIVLPGEAVPVGPGPGVLVFYEITRAPGPLFVRKAGIDVELSGW